jgi:ANTAR domain
MLTDEPFASGDADLLEADSGFADLVREACEQRERADNLEIALGSARIIGIAIGILVARHNVTPDEAFAELRRASQTQSRKVRDIADELVFSGLLAGEDDQLPMAAARRAG